MKKTNREIFEELPLNEYFKSAEVAKRFFRDMGQYPHTLGYDDESNGFLTLHRNHAPSGLASEIPVCIFLKKLGFRVILVEELPNQKSFDAEIDGVEFEIKQVAHAKNFTRAVLHQLRSAYHKCDNILLHIAQPIHGDQLRNALSIGIKTYPSIKKVWIVYNYQLYQLDRLAMLKKQF